MFDFLEVDNNEHKENIVHENIIKEIPEEQFLKYTDLITISPELNAVKIISKKILEKYSIVPLYIKIPSTKPLLPKHLKSEYWGHIHGEKNMTMFISMPEPFNNQVLNILKSISGYSIVSIPIEKESAKKFLKNDYNKIMFRNELKDIKKSNDLIKIVKENIFYIIFFVLILSLLFFVKSLIKV